MKAGMVSRKARIQGWVGHAVAQTSALALVAFAGLPVDCANAAVPDFQTDDGLLQPRYVELDEKSERSARAVSYYIAGLLDEDAAGPQSAFERFRRVLDLDPGFIDLAIKVADDHLRRGESAEAISVLKDAIKASPRSATPCLALSSIYLRQLGKPELALQYANRALEIAPREFSSYEALWEIHQAQGHTAKAFAILERASKVDTQEAQYWAELGDFVGRVLLREDGKISLSDVQRMSAIFEKAAKYADTQPDILTKVAYFYILSQQVPRAIPLLERALELRPGLDDARVKLAACYFENGQFEESTKLFETIVEGDPLNLKAYEALAELYARRNNWDRCVAALQQAVLLEPDDPQRQERLIVLLLDRARKPAQAVLQLEDAMRRFPDPKFAVLHAVALSQAKRHDEAIRAFEKMAVEFSTRYPQLLDSDFYFNYGAVAEQAGKLDRAADLLRKSISLAPAAAARAYNYLGYMWADRNQNLAEAEQLIQRALQAEPENAAYRDSLGWVYFRMGRTNEALNELLRAAELLPEPDAVVLDHIGDVYQKLGNLPLALSYWRKAIALDPENKAIVDKIDAVAEKVAVGSTP